jgi:hypothetical protein
VDGFTSQRWVDTDASGRYALDVLDSDGDASWSLMPPAPYMSFGFAEPLPETTRDIVLRVGRTISGRVLGPGGHPLRTVAVRLSDGTRVFSDESDAAGKFGGVEGHYSIQLFPGTYTLQLESRVPLSFPGMPRTFFTVPMPGFVVTGDQENRDIILSDVVRIHGRVTNENGVPLVGATLSASTHRTMPLPRSTHGASTDASGAYELFALRKQLRPCQPGRRLRPGRSREEHRPVVARQHGADHSTRRSPARPGPPPTTRAPPGSWRSPPASPAAPCRW